MSFTAEVKDELSRIEGDLGSEMVELAAMVRVCGTLSFSGQQRFRLSLSTETGAVARTLIKLFHGVYSLKTELTVRRSVLHKTRNYLIVVPEQPHLVQALVQMGVLTQDRLLRRDIDERLVARDEWARAYLRGAFMGGGFISDPHADAHFELVVQGKPLADGIAALLARFGVGGHVGRRRGSYVIYLKNAQDILDFLALVGAPTSALAMEDARVIKSLRNDANRQVNAELANQKKTANAASDQVELIESLAEEVGLSNLPPALREFCEMRLAHRDLSLRELGEACDPPLSKSAVYHRVRRLEELLAVSRAQSAATGVESSR